MSQINRVYSGRAASTVIFAVALYLCSLCAYTIMGGSHTLSDMLGDVRVSVEVKENTKIDIIKTKTLLEDIQGVSSAKYVDSGSAEREFSGFAGVDVTKFMGGNVLPDSFILTINCDSKVDSLEKTLRSNDWVEDVYYESAVPIRVSETISFIKKFANGLAILFAVCALVMGYLAIKLSIGAQVGGYGKRAKKEIALQSYRWAWIGGVLSAVFASLMLYFTIAYARVALPSLNFTLDTIPLIAAGVLTLSVLSYMLFTFIALLATDK